MPGALATKVTASEPPQLRLYKWDELVERRVVSFSPRGEQLGDLGGRSWRCRAG